MSSRAMVGQVVTKRQLEWIDAHTFIGPSRVDWLRRLVKLGIEAYEKEEKAKKEDMDRLHLLIVALMGGCG